MFYQFQSYAHSDNQWPSAGGMFITLDKTNVALGSLGHGPPFYEYVGAGAAVAAAAVTLFIYRTRRRMSSSAGEVGSTPLAQAPHP